MTRPVNRPHKKPGRKRLNTRNLPRGWKEKMIELATEGKGPLDWRVHALGMLDDETFDRMVRDCPVFAAVTRKARMLYQIWWTDKGHNSLDSKTLREKNYTLQMMNRFGWGKKQENKNTGSVEVNVVNYGDGQPKKGK